MPERLAHLTPFGASALVVYFGVVALTTAGIAVSRHDPIKWLCAAVSIFATVVMIVLGVLGALGRSH